jgi:hypothetical protein
MGWFSRRNETSGWQEAATPLVLDLDTFRLCGTACGDSADLVSFLGPGTPGLRSSEYVFPAHGLTIEIAGGQLRSFHAHVRPTPDEVAAGIRPYPGAIRHRGNQLDPSAIAGEAAAVARFGEPDVVEAADDQRVLTFDAGGTEWELILSADGRLATVSVYGGG